MIERQINNERKEYINNERKEYINVSGYGVMLLFVQIYVLKWNSHNMYGLFNSKLK